MKTNLKEYFPLIRTRTELLVEIHSHEKLSDLFESWTPARREEFLDFCTGVRGVKLLYDSFFKEIINPESTPERLEEFLSILLGSQVKILAVLPNDSTRIADEQSLLITDIVVELEDGGIVNVEIQKIGYRFPGQRSACYSSDLLLRQYKRVRGQKENSFSYRDIRAVYTIVLFENSPPEFHKSPQNYIHFFAQKSDTGIELELLQNYCFIPLDIFRKSLHNKGISNKLDAWLAFFSIDDPEMIVQLITAYPEFKTLYEQVYSLCQNVEGVMDMFSEELRMLDRNTVRLMIDEQQEWIDRQKATIEQQRVEIDQQTAKIDQQKVEIDQQRVEIDQQRVEIDQQRVEIDQQTAKIDQQKVEIDQQKVEIDQQRVEIDQQRVEIDQQRVEIDQQRELIDQQNATLNKQRTTLNEQQVKLNEQRAQYEQQLIQERQKYEEERRQLLERIAALEG